MGGAASTQQVEEHVGGLGKAYQRYEKAITENGIDAEFILSLATDGKGDGGAPKHPM